jgi:hypothetical protein
MPIDRYFNRTWEIPFKFRGIERRFVIQHPGSIIDVSHRSTQDDAPLWKRFWGKTAYNVKTFIARLTHSLYEYARAPSPKRYQDDYVRE